MGALRNPMAQRTACPGRADRRANFTFGDLEESLGSDSSREEIRCGRLTPRTVVTKDSLAPSTADRVSSIWPMKPRRAITLASVR